MHKPKKVAVVHFRGHERGNSEGIKGNKLADAATIPSVPLCKFIPMHSHGETTDSPRESEDGRSTTMAKSGHLSKLLTGF